MKEIKDIINIDCDLIRELKQRGKKDEAKALLKAWRESLDKDKARVKREIQNQKNRIDRLRRRQEKDEM